MNLAGKRIVVTGGDGFLGKRVVRRLQHRGAFVGVPKIERFDLRYSELVDEMYQYFQPEIVINLAAAVGGIGANISQPGKFFYDNLMMGMNLIEGARVYGVEKFVQMGSACEYPGDAPVPSIEEYLWTGYPEESNAAYGVAKRALLTMGQAYRKQYGMNIIHLLSTNLYGPGDNFGENSHVIPAVIRKAVQAVENKDVVINMWGTGIATRDFLYVEDAAEAIVLATERYDNEKPVNLGSGREFSISEVTDKIGRLSGFTGYVVWDNRMPDGQSRRFLDTNRAKDEFGWEASTLLEAGLERTISWYKEKLRSAR